MYAVANWAIINSLRPSDAYICVGKLTIIGSDNGLSPDRHQAIIWTNAGILSIGPLGTKLSEILLAIHIFSFKKMRLKLSSGKWQPCCLGLNLLILIMPVRRQAITWINAGSIISVTDPCNGNLPGSTHKGQWRRALVFSLIWVWTNDWTSSGTACDLKHICLIRTQCVVTI